MKKNLYIKLKFPLLLFLVMCGVGALSGQTFTQTFNYSGSIQTFTVPSCVSTITIEAWGAEGGFGHFGALAGNGGRGGYAFGVVAVTQGAVINIYVGGIGTNAGAGVGGAGGFNGGGLGGSYTTLYGGGGGGGASDIRIGGNTLNDRVIVAGGGGGGSSYDLSNGGALGGAGGGLTGVSGLSYGSIISTKSGLGGSQTAGGANGTDTQAGSLIGSPGTFGLGGNSGVGGCSGGGGGGWYGGGGGSGCNGGGGGGGSSYYGGTGVTNGSTTNGVRTGNGLIVFRYSLSGTAVSVSTSSSSICNGNSVAFNASGAITYTWLPVGSFSGSNATSINHAPSTSQSYTVQGTNSIGCISTTVIPITVSAGVPVLSVVNSAAASSNSLCFGKTATLTASGALTYTWTNGVTNGASFVPANGNNNYTVSGQNGCGITTAVTTITASPLPVATLATPSVICYGNSANLTAVSAVNGYTWQPVGLSGANVAVTPTASVIYTVTASDGTCSGTSTLAMVVNPIPTISIVPSSGTVCQQSAVTMTASGASSYTWMTDNSTGTTFTANPAGPTSYQVIGINSFSCTSTAAQVILTNPSPPVTIVATKTLVCSGGLVNLTANGATIYNWTNGPSTALNAINPTASGVYTVGGSVAGNTCVTVKTILIAVIDPTVTIAASSNSVCNGAAVTLTASGANTYAWPGFPPGSVLNNVMPSATTIYTVIATTSSLGVNCPISKNITITVFTTPTLMIVPTRTAICRDEKGLKLEASGANSYTWNASNMTNTILVNPTTALNIFTVSGTDANGCYGEGMVQIKVNPCTGITEFGNSQTISIYPNPSNGEFTISAESDITLKVVNELGQEVKTIQLSAQNDHKVSVNNLADGIYFIVGQNNDVKINQKIVVNK